MPLPGNGSILSQTERVGYALPAGASVAQAFIPFVKEAVAEVVPVSLDVAGRPVPVTLCDSRRLHGRRYFPIHLRDFLDDSISSAPLLTALNRGRMWSSAMTAQQSQDQTVYRFSIR